MFKLISKFIGLFILIFCISCKEVNNENFETENKILINDYKIVINKFIKKKAQELSDEQMAYSLDSIDKLYMVDKNKELAEKFIITTKGLKRLNFLKKYYKIEELKVILKKVPENQKNNKDYIELKNYTQK